ncbi:MFS siderochrome iron transporter 1 [Meristemomyces frigidus]|uniref:MFS siderochrome iron transporter 1 n=1 Tax=Meristemomyces frigidus TaxID=1508187 RepID=A0AAN7YEY3_9PEZI|nr:MFS siderochrome iron transporter 1 [Meristemomyces frigidus]
MANEKDVESGRSTRIPHIKQVFDQSGITPEVENHDYRGSGTDEDPYVVTWIDDDPRNPMRYSAVKKWSLTMLVAIATLAVAFVSSAFSGGGKEIIAEFHCSQEVFTLGLSLFVLGFAVGPLIWAPMSELFGRQILYIITYGALTAFNAAAAGSQNIWTLIILRFFAGAFGSSPLTNAGGVIADIFPAKERGLALSLFAAAPFLGPVIGPIVGGFVGETIGWRWIQGIMAIFTGVLWILGSLLIPETYPPVIQRQRAKKLSKMTGKVYRSQGDVDQGPTTFGHVFKTSLSRPWVLLFREPIVFLLSIYMAIIYGTLYMLFGAFPIVYQQQRGWSAGVGGLAFLGLAVGMVIAVAYCIWDNKRYVKVADAHNGFAPPEARLPICMIGGIAIPIGLFWFAWTNYPNYQFMISIAAGIPFGFGMILVFLGIMNYLIDAYTIFAASVLAANAVLRSIFGTVFPLFTTQMYSGLGIHWASSVPAFLALACVPFPFLFYKYGAQIRKKCKYAAEAEAFMKKMQQQMEQNMDSSDDQEGTGSDAETAIASPHEQEEEKAEREKEGREEREEEEIEAIDYSYAPERAQTNRHSRGIFEEIKTQQQRPSGPAHAKSYEHNPFDLDRVNTRESFAAERNSLSRTNSRATERSRTGRMSLSRVGSRASRR